MRWPNRIPSTGQLIGEAVQHWLDNQSRFWVLAIPVAVALTALPLVINLPLPHKWLRLSVVTMIEARWLITPLLQGLVLYQWFKCALYDGGRQRAPIWQQDAFPRPMFLDLRFIAFWALYALLSHVSVEAVRELVRSDVSLTMALIPLLAINEFVLTLILAQFLLFLPACVAGLRWGPVRAFHEAASFRRPFIAIALLWALLPFIGYTSAYLPLLFVLPTNDAKWITLSAISGLTSNLASLLGGYILAHAVSRLFVARTGWTVKAVSDAVRDSVPR